MREKGTEEREQEGGRCRVAGKGERGRRGAAGGGGGEVGLGSLYTFFLDSIKSVWFGPVQSV